MVEHTIRLKELMDYHQVKGVYRNSVACFRLDSSLVNIDTVSPTFADIFSFLLVLSGTATFSINYQDHTVGHGDLLLLSPSTLVAITGQSADFEAINLMCDRSFLHCLSVILSFLLPDRFSSHPFVGRTGGGDSGFHAANFRYDFTCRCLSGKYHSSSVACSAVAGIGTG